MKKIIILVSFVFTAFLILYSQYFDYSEVLNGFNIPSETRSNFAIIFSLIILFFSILFYGNIIQNLTKTEFRKKLYLMLPLFFAIFLVFIINLIYFFLDEEFFCMWSCGRGYDFIEDFTGILFFYGVIGLVYGFIRLGLQHKFINFYQKKYLSISNFTNKKGVLIIIILWIINLILLTLIVIDYNTQGEKLHMSNDPGFTTIRDVSQ